MIFNKKRFSLAVSHQSVKFDVDDDRVSGLNLARSQSILSTNKRPQKNKSGKGKDQENRNVTIASGYQVRRHPGGGQEIDDEIVEMHEGAETRSRISKKDLKRSQSIPKDTKFPWLQKLGIRVKAREP